MKKMCNVYEVTNRDGDVIARGFADDVAMVMGCSAPNVNYLALFQGLYKGKFRVKKIGQRMKDYSHPDEYSDIITIEEETFVERYRDLDEHGNTIMSRKEYKRHRELIEGRGYRTKYRKVKCRKDEPYYIVEVL